MSLAIANRYASALADVLSEPGSPVSPEGALEQLESFRRLLDSSAELLNALTSPAVEPAKKRTLVQRLGEGIGLSTPVRNFLFVVIDHRRLRVLDEIIAAFRSWLDEKLGIARIEVTSARPIDESLQAAVLEKFARVTGRRIEAGFEVDEDLLGGAVVRHGSTVYDGSIRAQLRSLDRSIAGEA